jgi:hypothetical protein
MEMEHTTIAPKSTTMGNGKVTKSLEMAFTHSERALIMANGIKIEPMDVAILN